MESQFALANVKKSETKYHHVLAALPEDIAINIDPDGDGQYETIKEAVLTSLKPNEHELIDQALRGVELGNKRPTQMVGEIRRPFSDIGLEVEEKIVKSQLLAAMPHTIRSALVGHEKASIDEFASIADSMLSITGSQSSSNPFLIGVFLVDSGAERSVIPSSLVPSSLILPSTTKLTGVDGKNLATFGHMHTSVSVKSLRRNFQVNFIVTKTRAILGADFLTDNSLILNMKKQVLIDPLTNMSTSLMKSSSENAICISVQMNSNNFIKENYPQLISAPNYSYLPQNFDVTHRIETTGSPLYSKPRMLSPLKFKAAKEEFDKLLTLKIVRPSCSPWASPLLLVSFTRYLV